MGYLHDSRYDIAALCGFWSFIGHSLSAVSLNQTLVHVMYIQLSLVLQL
jgi:hypothetical protein